MPIDDKTRDNQLNELTAISPIDGRYGGRTSSLRASLSEYGLMKNRLEVEIGWLLTLSQELALDKEAKVKTINQKLKEIVREFSEKDGQKIKELEKSINHDVKAIEYFLQEKMLKEDLLKRLVPYIHFGCTSEDINNLAYGIMLENVRRNYVLPAIHSLCQTLRNLANRYANCSMLSRTHGQPATPTTMGKELANFVYRLESQAAKWSNLALKGKINGAVGNYNAFIVAYPNTDWQKISRKFVESLNLEFNPYTTQIEPHDSMACYFNELGLINSILIDLSQDIWAYISIGYFSQKQNKSEVGSSTMPHKINPIDFENAEGNLGISTALMQHFAQKLTISRLQRDLSDSTVLRNLGVALSHHLLATESLNKGLDKLDINEDKMSLDLEDCWDILAEPVQMVMRSCGIEDAYEQLKELSRGKPLDKKTIHDFVDSLDVPEEKIQLLKKLTPSKYVGLAPQLAKEI